MGNLFVKSVKVLMMLLIGASTTGFLFSFYMSLMAYKNSDYIPVIKLHSTIRSVTVAH
jgi:hypothetical protein